MSDAIADDVEEETIPSGKITLEQYVSFVLDNHLKFHSAEDKPRYGIFYRNQMLKTISGKFAFSSVGAAKIALYNCFYTAEQRYADRRYQYNYLGIDCINVEGTEYIREDKKRFREMLLKHVEIKRI